MAIEFKPNQMLQGDRYKVLKCLKQQGAEYVYSARDNSRGRKVLLRAYWPKPSLSAGALEDLTLRFQEVMTLLLSLDHPHLVKFYDYFTQDRLQVVVMEYLDGLTLEGLQEMSSRPLEREEVLPWLQAISSALHYLQDRPQPYFYGPLTPERLWVDLEGKIKLHSFKIEPYFQNERQPPRAITPLMVADEYHQLGEIAYWLLTRNIAPPIGQISEGGNVNAPLAEVINKLLSSKGASTIPYPQFEDLSKALEPILHPPLPQLIERASEPSKLNPWTWWSQFLGGWSQGSLAYRLGWMGALLVVVAAGYLVVASEVEPLPSAQPAPAVQPSASPAQPGNGYHCYLACGSELKIFALPSLRPTGTISLPSPIRALAATQDGEKLYGSSAQEGVIYLLNPRSQEVISTLSVEPGVSQMVLNPPETFLFAQHAASGYLSVLGLNPDPLPAQPPAQGYQEEVVNLYALGTKRSEPEGPLMATSTLENTQAAGQPFPRLAAASQGDNRLMTFVYEHPQPTQIEDATSPNPSTLAIDSPGQTLFVGSHNPSQVALYQLPGLNQTALWRETGGEGVQDLQLSSKGDILWVLNASGELGSIEVASGKLQETVPLEATPIAMRLMPDPAGDRLLVATSQPPRLLLVDPHLGPIQTVPLQSAPSDLTLLPPWKDK